MASSEVLVSLHDVEKDYRALRPLRVRHLELRQQESIALTGLDRAAAEVLVNLITAATLPDAGIVNIFGAPTGDIVDPDSWLRTLDHFGILSERVVLLDELTVEQNLTLPLTLEIEAIPHAIRQRVGELADEVGIAREQLNRPVAALSPGLRLRVRLAKALVLNPRVLLAEHPNAMLPPEDISRFAADLSRLVSSRRLAALVITTDNAFARAVSQRVLALRPATGALTPTGWRRWFGQACF